MRPCARCGRETPRHLLFWVRTGHGGRWYCGPCRDAWLAREARAAVAAEGPLEETLQCDECGRPAPRLIQGRCPTCSARRWRAARVERPS